MTSSETQEPGLTQIERIVDTFVAPSDTFRDILRSASWWLPYLLLVAATVAVSVSVERKVGFEQVVENQIRASPAQESQFNALQPAARAARLHAMATGYRYTSYAYPALLLFVAAFGSLILWVSFNFVLGSRASYGQILCLWMYASVPRLLAALVTVITLWFGGSPESFTLQQPAGTNPGYYLSDAAPWLRTLLSFFDVVGIWVLVLLIVGGAIVARVRTTQSAAVVLGWWLLIVIVSVVSTAAFR